MRDLIGRHRRLLRVTGAALSTLFLMSFAVVNYEALVAQEAGVGIRLVDLSEYPTHLTVDGFDVELTNLTTAAAYEVVVSSDSARVGIGGCGTQSETAPVTGVEARVLSFAVYACAVGEATLTAEVRWAEGSSLEASVSQELKVEALPEIVIGPKGERIRTTTTQEAAVQGTSEAAAQGRSVTAAQAPKVGTPGIVPRATIEFNDIMATSVRVTWGQPSSGGPGKKLTGFGLKFWKDEIPEPSYLLEYLDIVGPLPPNTPPDTPSEYTKPGLEPNKLYNFRIHACNGKDSCGYWTNPAMQFRTLRKATPTPTPTSTPGRPDAPHTIKFPSVGTSSFTVKWSPHLNTGGSKLTGFGILVGEIKEGEAEWPSDSATKWAGRTARTYVVNMLDDETALTPGTTYVVKVKSCNGAGGRTSCGNWSVDSRVTTTGGTGPGQNVLSPAESLDITPISKFKAILTWTHSSPANVTVAHHVEVRKYDGTAWPATESASHSKVAHGNSYEIDLTSIYKPSLKNTYGLADSPYAYELRVKATALNHTPSYSQSVVIIDTPVHTANGDSPNDNDPETGQIHLQWKSIEDILPSYQTLPSLPQPTKTTRFRYRQMAGDHTAYSAWEPEDDPNGEGRFEDDNTTSRNPITGLTKKAIYAIQLRYTQSGKPPVYAATNFYAWTSPSAPKNGERIATVPVSNRLPNRQFTYRICEGTFPSTRLEAWVDLINHALLQWQNAINQWGARSHLITVMFDTYSASELAADIAIYPAIEDLDISPGDSKLCGHYNRFVEEVVNYIKHDSRVPRDTDYRTLLNNFLDTLEVTNMFGQTLSTVQSLDEGINEIKFEDDDSVEAQKLNSTGVFAWIARDLGYAWCWDSDDISACAVSRRDANGDAIDSDIFFRKSVLFYSATRIPGDDLIASKDDVYYAQCIGSDYSAYVAMRHEAGHALGIGNAVTGHGHSSVYDSVMTTKSGGPSGFRDQCGPSAFDVLALTVLYQPYR